MDGGELFRKYWEMGDARSFARLQKFVEQETGTRPTQMGIWKSMWRWASLKENKSDAWEIYRQFNDIDHDSWVSLMLNNIRQAWQYNTDGKYNRFLKENGWK